jgi:hypothetical protein
MYRIYSLVNTTNCKRKEQLQGFQKKYKSMKKPHEIFDLFSFFDFPLIISKILEAARNAKKILHRNERVYPHYCFVRIN